MTFEVGDYRATEMIGAGGSAQVWRGIRVSTGSVVAIKVYPADQLAAARREAALATAVNHPHVVAVLDVVSDADRSALITEYAAGGDLADLLSRRGRLSAGETLTVLLPLAAALATAHERDIMHGDLSAQNVVFDRAGRPLLADLGAGRAAAESGLQVAATPADAAPELARGGPSTPATDMFSLGSLALACLTGRHAWPADDLRDVLIQAAAGQWPDPGDDAGSPALVAAVRALLEHDPEHRPGAASLVLDLRAAGRPEPLNLDPGPEPSSGGSEPRPQGRVGRHGLPAKIGEPTGPEPGRPDRPETPGRARAITRVRSDAVPQVATRPAPRRGIFGLGRRRTGAADGSERPPFRAVRTAVVVLCCVVVALLAVAGGLWWAGWDRPEPIADAVLGTTSASSAGLSGTSPTPTASSPPVRGARGQLSNPAPTPMRSPPKPSSKAQVSAPGVATSHPGPSRPPGPITSPVPAISPGIQPPAATGVLAGPPPVPVDWTVTVRALDEARARALVARDARLLEQVYTADSSARRADSAMIASLLSSGLRVSGAHHAVLQTRQLAGSPTRVVVDDSLPSYSVLDAAGRIVGRTTARAAGQRTLVLILTSSGYRISQVESP